MTTFTAIVPMRHNSRRVPGKNFRPMAGKPLFVHVIDTLRACPSVGRIVIDTDSADVRAAVAQHCPDVTLIDRPAHLADDHTPMNDVLMHAVSRLSGERFLQTHSTNPLLKPGTIENAISTWLRATAHDSLFSVTPLQQRLYDASGRPMNHDPAKLIRTQDLPPIYLENSCLYLFSRQSLFANRNRLGTSPLMFPMDRLESTDIDEEHDWQLAESLLGQQGVSRGRAA